MRDIRKKPQYIVLLKDILSFINSEKENIGISSKYGGSGLGMAITEQITRLMGGDIVVDTYPGKGSDFKIFLTLPAASPAAETAASTVGDEAEGTERFSFKGKHILVAEDNAINAEIAVDLLEYMGAVVEIARNGGTVVDEFKNNPAGTYDFILMDVQMPVMDGREATRTIRALDRPDAKTIPIFALSADAFTEDQRLSRAAGMNGHFAKPVDFEKLEKEIGKILK